ncbi:cob(I)yrinic acid a,c-diamide adenosyltransferase [Collinsella vaginalis]|uniref:cob(I)yrinic acid a,c-diamide adenosyltransferase n=1 Tax=Collinsella vaginalis TaxID=1870987 RepID=UPI000A2710F0|nr:cob(I)yrinic acid a,c-diamide adenosyltransferase [Collinsella vaginalis]
MNQLECGRVQIYTGDGKGKTTAALGLALRALGYDLDVLMLQFAKKLICAEHVAAERLGLRIVQATGPTPAARADEIMGMAREALAGATGTAEPGRPVDVLILDELGEAMRRGFVTRADVEALLAIKPATTELVLTGRGLLDLSDLADLVTEMVPHKHYFDEGLLARRGIEY